MTMEMRRRYSFFLSKGRYPKTSIRPLEGMIRPDSIFSVVVFPAPFKPIRPVIAPLGIWKERSLTALLRSGSRWNRFLRLPLSPGSFL